MKYLIGSVIFIASLSLYSQNITAPEGYEAKENLRELASMSGTGNVKLFDNRYQGVKGTPFIFEDWVAGEVFMSDKKRIFFNDMNYNCFDNELAYIEPASNKTLVMNKYVIDLFMLFTDDTLTFVPVKLTDKGQQIFAQVLYNQKSTVYKVFKKEFLRANFEGGYSADRRYDEFIDKSDIYFMKHDEKILYKTKSSKKYMIAAFEDTEAEISKFIKVNGLKFKDEGDVVALIKYYDSL